MNVVMPDGTIITDVPEGTTQEDLLERYQAYTGVVKPSVRDTGFTGAAKASIQQIQADAYKTAGKLGILPVKEAEAESAKYERRAREIFQPTEKDFFEPSGQKFRELLGGSLPYVAAPLAAAGVGALAVPSAPVLAPAIAAGLAGTAQYTGSNLARQMEADKKGLEETNLGYAFAGAVPQALLDTYSLGMTPLIRRMFASAGINLAESQAVDIAKRGLMSTLKDYGGVTAKTATREGLTEAAQQSIERLQAGLNITDAEARKEYFDSFIGGAVLGGTLAPIGRYLEGPARASDQGIRPPADQVNPLTDQPSTLTDPNLPGAAPETFKQSTVDTGMARGQQLYQEKAPLTPTTPIGGAIDTSVPLGRELSSTQAEVEALGKQNATLLAPEAATVQPTVAPEESASLALRLSEGLKQNPALRTQFEAAKQEFDTQGRLDLSQVFQTVLDTVPPVLTTPVIAPEVQQKVQEVRKTLIPALKKYGLEGTGLQIMDNIGNGQAEGYYAQNLITVALDSDNHLGAMRHETVHALKNLNAFTPQEWRVLTNKAKSDWIPQFISPENQVRYRDQYAQDNNGDMTGFDEYLQEEGIAEAFKHFNNKMPAGMVGNLMYRLKQFFQSLKNTFSGQGFNTSDSIFRGIEATKYKPQAATQARGKFAKRDSKAKAEDDFELILEDAGMGAASRPPYKGAKKSEDGFWLSRDGKYTVYPVGGYGFKVVPLDTARFLGENGIGFAHPNTEVIKIFEAAREGKDPTVAHKELIKQINEFAKTPEDRAEGKATADNILQKAKEHFGIAPRFSFVRKATKGEKEISTQNATGVKAKFNPLEDIYSIDEKAVLEAMEINPAIKARTIEAIKDYGFIPKDTADDQVIPLFKKNIVNNLLFLYNSVPAEIRNRSKLWYDGANKIAKQMGKEYDLTDMQVSGILAAMSPQKDWFQNVSMAERAIDILSKRGDMAWDANMLKYAQSYVKNTKDRKEREKRGLAYKKIEKTAKDGTKLKDMDIESAAAFVRAYDEAFHSRSYRIVTPEGGFSGLVMNMPDKKGDIKESTLMWSTYDPIEKSVSIYRNGSRDNISQQLGFEHKIRSFYNNIVAPNSDISHVTIDTHAVAAGLFEALAGSDLAVAQNFGATGTADNIGVGGTYGLIADAYRDAAKQVGMKAREMQSITWEAVRGLFDENMKSSMKAPIRGQWTKYKNGDQTFEQARAKIIKIAGGMNDPQWVGSDAGKTIAEGASSYDKSYQPEGGVRLREEMDIREKITVNLSNVTSSIPGLNELYQRSMSGDEKAYAVLQDTAKAHLQHLLSGTSAKVNIEPVMGAYGSEREPAINAALAFPEADRKDVMAALARFATNFNQQQVHVRQATAYPFGHDFGDGSYATNVWKMGINRQLTNDELAEIIKETGIPAITVAGKEKDGKTQWTATTYFVDPFENTEKAYEEYIQQVKSLDKALARVVGRSDKTVKPSVERLYVYGTGDGARLGYESIAGDVRPKEANDTRSSKLIAEYFKGEPVSGFKQKGLNKDEIAAQKSLVKIFEALPNNDLKRPIVRRAYTALANELKEQYKILPIKVEVVTDVMLDGKSYDYFGEKGVEKLKARLTQGMTKDEADSAIKYLQDNYGEPDPTWKTKSGLLARIEADNKDIYPRELGSKAMRDDVNLNNRLKVYKTAPDTFGPKGSSFKSHPLLKPSGLKDANGYPMLYNDLLRAVHDYYSHNLTPAEFGPRGELAAARNHLAVTKDPMAKWALIAETRLQNAWQNFREGVEAIPLIDRPYATQKAALPPIEYALSGDPLTDVSVRKLMEELTFEQSLGSLPPSAPIAKNFRFSLREPASRIKAPDTPAFKQWFGDSKIVDYKGRPLVMFHGTARDITEFKPKQANAIFLTSDPTFAEDFGDASEAYMIKELFNGATPQERNKYIMDGAAVARKNGDISAKEFAEIKSDFSQMDVTFGLIPSSIEQEVTYILKNQLPTRQNIIPMFVSSENPFDFGNKQQVDALTKELNKPEYNRFLNEEDKRYGDKNRGFIERGHWNTIESDRVQSALKKLGHDGFFVLEGGRKNLAVYDPAQVKSAIGNIGTYDITNPDIRFALNAPPKQLTAQTPVYTAGQQVQQAASAAHQVFTTDPNEFWTKLRINWVDPNAGLTKRLQNLPIFDTKGQLRADMLNRARAQSINLIKNGLTGGIPVLNTDGSIIIKNDAVNNLANSQLLADGLNNNQFVKDSGLDGRGYVAEVARALRGEEIMQEDAAHNAVNPPAKHLNREKQVDAAQIAWAKQQIQNVPELRDIFSIWKNVNTSLVDLWEKVGLLDAQTANEYRGKKSYISLAASIADMEERMGEGFGHSYTGTKGVKKIQRLEGSDLFRNIWENVSKQYASMVAGAYQNQTRKVAVDQLQSLGLAKITNPTDSDINLRYKDQNHPQANKEGIVSVVVDNPNDVAAFESMHYQLSPIMKAMSGATGVLRAGALLNPMFWIRQLIRDPIQAALTNSPVVTPLHSAKEFISILRRDSAEARLLAERGVIGPVDSTLDLQDFLETAGQKFAKRGGTSAMLDKLMEMHEASDAATRVAIYKKAKQEALARGLNDVDATNEAVYKARESINFAVRGNSPTLAALRHMTPFLSAAISSLDVLYKAATGYGLPPKERAEARAMFKRRAMMMGVMSIAYAMMMQDDEEYKKVPDYIRDNNWLIHNPFGDGFIKIPTPFEVGFLLKTIPEGMVRYISGNSTGKQVIKSYLNGLGNSLPGDAVPLPQLIKPAVEAITNYSLFTYSPIESIGESKLPVEMRGRKASETAKLLSQAGLGGIGLSPAKIDHLIQGYFAEWGSFSTFLFDKAVTEAKGETPMDKNLAQQPFFKSFITDPTRDKVVGDFYDLYRTANQVSAAVKEYKSVGAYSAIEDIYADEDKVKLLRAAPALNRIADSMGKINKQIRLIQSSQNIPPDERLERVNVLEGQLARVARQHLQLSKSLGI